MKDSQWPSPIALLLLGVAELVLVGLKMTDVIDWSWGWVFGPIYLALLAGAVISAVSTVRAATSKRRSDQR